MSLDKIRQFPCFFPKRECWLLHFPELFLKLKQQCPFLTMVFSWNLCCWVICFRISTKVLTYFWSPSSVALCGWSWEKRDQLWFRSFTSEERKNGTDWRWEFFWNQEMREVFPMGNIWKTTCVFSTGNFQPKNFGFKRSCRFPLNK